MRHLIDTGDLHVSRDAARSARNRLVGLVTSVIVDRVTAEVEVQCGPHRMVSLISSEAVRELRLQPAVMVPGYRGHAVGVTAGLCTPSTSSLTRSRNTAPETPTGAGQRRYHHTGHKTGRHQRPDHREPPLRRRDRPGQLNRDDHHDVGADQPPGGISRAVEQPQGPGHSEDRLIVDAAARSLRQSGRGAYEQGW